MFGIVFAGHPDLRNMYLPTDFEGFPLRKDFPLLARMVKPWPGIVDVEPMPAEDQPPQDEVTGELAPENLTPDQADGGVGSPPAEDLADEEALEHSVEEAPGLRAAAPRRRGSDRLRGPAGAGRPPDLEVDPRRGRHRRPDGQLARGPGGHRGSPPRRRDGRDGRRRADADTDGGADPATATEAAYGDDEPGDRDGGAPCATQWRVDEAPSRRQRATQ